MKTAPLGAVRTVESFPEPQVRIELTTARLRIGCSTPELLWQVYVLPYPDLLGGYGTFPPASLEALYALERTRTAMPFGTTPSRWRVYQFHHQGKAAARSRLSTPSRFNTGPTGLEPATSRVTVECSNQTELRPQLQSRGRKPLPHAHSSNRIVCQAIRRDSPKGNRTPLCTVKGCRPNR
jgi:hypothetical protein